MTLGPGRKHHPVGVTDVVTRPAAAAAARRQRTPGDAKVMKEYSAEGKRGRRRGLAEEKEGKIYEVWQDFVRESKKKAIKKESGKERERLK